MSSSFLVSCCSVPCPWLPRHPPCARSVALVSLSGKLFLQYSPGLILSPCRLYAHVALSVKPHLTLLLIRVAHFPSRQSPCLPVCFTFLFSIYHCLVGFPGGASGKEPACQCRRHKRRRFYPWVGKIPWRRAWLPTPMGSWLENLMDRGACRVTVRGVATHLK